MPTDSPASYLLSRLTALFDEVADDYPTYTVNFSFGTDRNEGTEKISVGAEIYENPKKDRLTADEGTDPCGPF